MPATKKIPLKYALPFKEQIKFFQNKVNLPTEHYSDLIEGQHARAFMVAGAMKNDLLVDLRAAVDKAIASGTTRDVFKRDFIAIAEKHGWGYNGKPSWRARVIWETNMNMSFAEGRYEQMKKLTRVRPYWVYRIDNAVKTHRDEHVGWNNLALPHDHPFWQTHYPPNGWGCKCFVEPKSLDDLKKMGKAGPDEFEVPEPTKVNIGPKNGPKRLVDKYPGIDPGFAYNVGESTWGRRLAADEWAKEQAKGRAGVKILTPGSWASLGRPERVPFDKVDIAKGKKLKTAEEVAAELERLLGGKEKVFRVAGHPVLVSTDELAKHLDPDRADYLPAIVSALEDPYEVWLAFEQQQATKKVSLRMRLIKGIDLGNRLLLLTLDAGQKGAFVGYSFVPTQRENYINNNRVGQLLLGKD